MDSINEYNITAQVVSKTDTSKQSLLFNDSVYTSSVEEAAILFNKSYEHIYDIMKIYSISQVN